MVSNLTEFELFIPNKLEITKWPSFYKDDVSFLESLKVQIEKLLKLHHEGFRLDFKRTLAYGGW